MVVFTAAWVVIRMEWLPTKFTAQGWTMRLRMPWLCVCTGHHWLAASCPALRQKDGARLMAPIPLRWSKGMSIRAQSLAAMQPGDMACILARVEASDAALTILPETAFPTLPETVPAERSRTDTSHITQEKATRQPPLKLVDNIFLNEAWLINTYVAQRPR